MHGRGGGEHCRRSVRRDDDGVCLQWGEGDPPATRCSQDRERLPRDRIRDKGLRDRLEDIVRVTTAELRRETCDARKARDWLEIVMR